MKICVAVVVLGVLAAGTGAGEKKRDDVAVRKEAILKRFVDELVPLTPGNGKHPASFVMGSDAQAAEKPAHRVTFTHPFAIARYEVTQELYQVVTGETASRWQGPRNSVEMVDWRQANDFCSRATKLLRERKLLAEDERIRLPSEAEWEYACRAGSTSRYAFGDDAAELTHHAWYRDNSKGHDPPVGAKRPNAWGLYDMHGYVHEWCADRWHADYAHAPVDGSAWDDGDGKERVLRGGAWSASADEARSSARRHAAIDTRSDAIGFRCVKDVVREKGTP